MTTSLNSVRPGDCAPAGEISCSTGSINPMCSYSGGNRAGEIPL